MRALLERVVLTAGRRPGRVLLAVALVAGISAVLALRLEPSTAVETLVGKSSDSYRATEVYRQKFGDHAIVVLAKGDLANLVLTDNLGRLLGLEGCISGNKPKDQAAPGGPKSPCAEFARTKPVKVVYGPGTFINSAVNEINSQLAVQLGNTQQQAARAKQAARKLAKARGKSKADQDKAASAAEQLVYAQFTRDLLQINLRYGLGLKQLPRIDDPDFVSALVFDPSRGATTPKARFAYLFPTDKAAVIQVRLKPNLTEHQRRRAIELVREAVAMKQWQLKNGASYTVTGAPVLVEDLAAALTDSLLRLLVVAILVMAIVLALVFRSRLRLLPLAVALAAVAITFGLMSLLGASLTMASIAVLPVLLGLGGRLRDPVPGAGGGGGRRRAAHRAHRGADDRHRGAGHERRLPGAAAVAGADGARLRRAAGGGHRDRVLPRPQRGHRGAGGDRAAARGRRRSSAPRRAGRPSSSTSWARACGACSRRCGGSAAGRARPRCAARSSGRSACC